MASIGGYTVDSLRGQIAGLGETVEAITRPGVDGQAYRLTGRQAPLVQMVSFVAVGSKSGLKTTLAAYRALQGTLVRVTDDAGNSYQNVMVLNVEVAQVHGIKRGIGLTNSNAVAGLWCVWTLQATE